MSKNIAKAQFFHDQSSPQKKNRKTLKKPHTFLLTKGMLWGYDIHMVFQVFCKWYDKVPLEIGYRKITKGRNTHTHRHTSIWIVLPVYLRWTSTSFSTYYTSVPGQSAQFVSVVGKGELRPHQKKTWCPRPFGLIYASTLTIVGGNAGVSAGNYGANTGPTLFFGTLLI